ncbi:MAG: 2-amino-4-hydroxy-6-hydroxymethyldihydropteridine diphosphokinase [Proteobacteria bacterium]|nr:2-amino-4-hydroxy-6-hydroxymethyldihydropteridine diphosphokinase [Pseudomonadota bacterium]
MERVFVGVGSNIDPEHNVVGALKLLGSKVAIVAVSTFYRTEPIGSPPEYVNPEYVNGVVEITTEITPNGLKHEVLRSVEQSFGRVRNAEKNSPRTIDLDLLLYGQRVIDEETLQLPDPDITERPFILLPLVELAPELLLPGPGVKISDLAESYCKENGVMTNPGKPFKAAKMEALDAFTDRLRKELAFK